MKVKELIDFYDKYNCNNIGFSTNNIREIYINNSNKSIIFISDKNDILNPNKRIINSNIYDFILYYPNYNIMKDIDNITIDVTQLKVETNYSNEAIWAII